MTTAFSTAARTVLAEIIGSVAAHEAHLTVHFLPGGSEAAAVGRVRARYRAPDGSERVVSAVIKHLTGRARRELEVYRHLVKEHAADMAPRVLGAHRDGTGVYMAVEAISRMNAWPWRKLNPTVAMMRQLGAFHASTATVTRPALQDWDYEAELAASALETGMRLDRCRRDPDLAPLVRHSRHLDRVVLELPRLRRMLRRESPVSSRSIHGDVHPGNAMIRRGARISPVLIDWGRARPGSPLEDVSSMLQSLRLYEPLAMRRHDSLWKEHLTGLGFERRITDPLRSAYWVAAVSNALAGALNVHLMAAADPRLDTVKRRAAFLACRDWLRIVRRAHAWAL